MNDEAKELARKGGFIEINELFFGTSDVLGIGLPVVDLQSGRRIPTLRDSCMTIPEMIEEAIASAGVAIDPSAIFAYVREHHKPEARRNDVTPTIWRMWKKGRLAKIGRAYLLPSMASECGA